MFRKNILFGAGIALMSLGSAAVASTVSLTGGTPVVALGAGSPAGQDFVTQLLAAGVDTLYSGPLQLNARGPVEVTFSLVAAESGFSNSLLFDDTTVITETVGNASVADFLTDTLLGQTFSTSFAGGDLAALLSFDINGDGTAEFGSDDDEFGIFAAAADIGSLSTFFLALDDSGASGDDNHDDILVRVEVAAVPLPAGGLLLAGGLGGLVALRRRRKS